MPDTQLDPDDEDVQQCIEDCQRCHNDCLRMAMNHCLNLGGRHLAKDHFALLLNCAEMCQTAANALLCGSPLFGTMCQACGELCEACADSCEAVGDMDDCVESCRLCADSCFQLAGELVDHDAD